MGGRFLLPTAAASTVITMKINGIKPNGNSGIMAISCSEWVKFM
jgi:hypothetical protein